MWQGFPCVLLMKRRSCCCQTTGCSAHAGESQNEPLTFLPYRNKYCERNFIPLLLQWGFLQRGAGRGCWGHCDHKECKTTAIRLLDKETVPGSKLRAGSVEEGTGHLILSSVLLREQTLTNPILSWGHRGIWKQQQQQQPSLTLQWGLNLTSCWVR